MLGSSWWFTTAYIAHSIALYSYLYRLKCKWKMGKAGSDDLLYLAAEAFNGVLLGIAIFVHIRFYQQELFPNTAYILSLNSYFMAIWIMRAGISVSHMRSLRIITDDVHKQVTISFLFVMIGIAFSISGTVICLRRFARVQEMHHGHLPLAFILPAISSDIIADSYSVFVTYRFFMATTFRPMQKIFTIVGFCGPLSTMLITTVSWTLSLTAFSFNTLAQMSILNLAVCYSIAMGSMPNIARAVYRQEFPTFEATPRTTHADIVFHRTDQTTSELVLSVDHGGRGRECVDT